MASLNKVMIIGNLGRDPEHVTCQWRRDDDDRSSNHRNLETNKPAKRKKRPNGIVTFFGKVGRDL